MRQARKRSTPEFTLHKRTPEQTARLALVLQPPPVVRRYPGKSWAGALVSNLDDAFGLGQIGRGMAWETVPDGDDDASYPVRAWEEIE